MKTILATVILALLAVGADAAPRRVHMRHYWSATIGPWDVKLIRLTGRTTMPCEMTRQTEAGELQVTIFTPQKNRLSLSFLTERFGEMKDGKSSPGSLKLGGATFQVSVERLDHIASHSLLVSLPPQPRLVTALKSAAAASLRFGTPAASLTLPLDRFAQAYDACVDAKQRPPDYAVVP